MQHWAKRNILDWLGNGPDLFTPSSGQMDSTEAAILANNNLHPPLLAHAHVPEDIQEVRSHNPSIIENSYVLHARENSGKPPDRFCLHLKCTHFYSCGQFRLNIAFRGLLCKKVNLERYLAANGVV